jgi:protein kinase C substrate 80K-H
MLPLLFSIATTDRFLGVPPDQRPQYSSALNDANGTFSCFDGSAVIPLSWFNDRYPDCLDGSDEPGTSDGPSSFYCDNSGSLPLTLARWSVLDGLCDCCDGSDEFFNAAASCPNTCPALEADRCRLIQRLTSVYESGLSDREALRQEGTHLLEGIEMRKAGHRNATADLEWRLEMAEHAPVIEDDSGDGRHPIDFTSPGLSSFWRAAFVRTWRTTFVPIEGDNPYSQAPISELEKSQRTHDLRSSMRESERKLESEENLGRFAEQDPPMEFVPLYGKEFASGEFRMQFGVNLMQGSTLLGNYKGVADGVMKFENGQYCREFRKSRSAVMKLGCGNETKLLSVVETGQCEFVARSVSPVACDREQIGALETLALPELERLVRDL